MGLKKYEIITVGSDKRVRALRSWQVGDRYVNIGDVGGIVYDEKTLSQDGACWLFRGNFGFPGARIGGGSIVDVGEATLSATGTPNVDILGSSVVVGSKLLFESEQTAADAVVLTAADFEQGAITYAKGVNWETWKTPSVYCIRLKAPIFMGGVAATLKLDVPGYSVQAFVMDRDGIGTASSALINTGKGVTLTIPAGQYFTLKLIKDPVSAIVPADATAAQITFTGTYETKLSVIDSRVEINPATSTGTATIRPGGSYTMVPGAKYPEAIIRNSRVSMMVHATAGRSFRLMGQIIGSTATLDATAGDLSVSGQYGNVKNLRVSGVLTSDLGLKIYNSIQATNCDNFKIDPTVISPRAFNAAIAVNMPFIFQGCNVPNGIFYHHAQIANTYRDINFDLATADLGGRTSNGFLMVSSEINGLYRLYHPSGDFFAALVENHKSVKSLILTGGSSSYSTTIYADSYLNGAIKFTGTNVFGNTMKHEASNTQNVMTVPGNYNATAVGGKITGFASADNYVCIPAPVRINGSKGLTISNLPAGITALMFITDASDVITRLQSTTVTNTDLAANALVDCKAYIRFGKTAGGAITPEEVAGVTITTYNGCKLVNTKNTAATIAGKVLVEDNATLIDTSVTGTGYFGGNSIAQGLTAEGEAYMKDNAVFAPTISGTPKANILQMTDNASFTAAWSGAGTRLVMSDNTRFESLTNHNTSGFVEMHDNASVSGSGSVSVSGILILQDDASLAGGNASISGHITLCGKYKQTTAKTWTGKRTITDVNEPEYDNNVKTQYDF